MFATICSRCLVLARHYGSQLVLGLLVVVFVVTGCIGLDFGNHWDESSTLKRIGQPVIKGVFLPDTYNYPSMVFDLGTIALAPELIPFLLQTAKDLTPYTFQTYQEMVPKEKATAVFSRVMSKRFLFRLRAIFLLITSLTGVWVYLAVRACQRSGSEAVFAAAIVLTSWEIAYHARWVAPDAIQMQFGALWLMFFAYAVHSVSRPLFWLRLSAAAAGLACGTKYQGGILLLPVLVYTAVAVRNSSNLRPGRALAKEVISNGAIFGLLFLMTTPGMILQPLIFYQSLQHISYQYATGHFGYSIEAGLEHAYRLFCYLTCVLASHWPVAALLLSGVACWGMAVMWKERPLTAAVFLLAPLLYVLVVMSYRVMIVRNYLLLAPFMAFFAARGASQIWNALAGAVWLRRMAATCFMVLFAGNVIFLCFASYTILTRISQDFGQDIVRYLKTHGSQKYFLSPIVAQLVADQNATLSNVTGDPNAAHRYMVFNTEVDSARWSSNRLGQYHRVSGPLEVNFDYYASWEGAPRVFELSIQRAIEMELFSRE